ncbi:MAG: hypothetical protein MUF33_09110 [Candidatus Nanopelagicales bacterium]|nr:hypothetical protein [Candidatus Nanopelagicales bacterium]
MRVFGLLLATFVWILCWVIAPASWWLNERILDEQAFEATMRQVLEIEEVDAQITDQATAGVIDGARDFVGRTVPFLAPQADVLLDRAQPTVSTLVNKAVNSQPGERAMLEASSQVHNVFLAWLDEDTLGQPGLQADLSEGQATFDLDQMLAGEVVTLGPVEVPLDAIDVPGLSVPVPLPPDWMRVPLNFVRSALVPAILGILAAGAALVLLERGRLRALAIAAGLTALVCGLTAFVVSSTWTLSGADTADWTMARAIGELMVEPWITAYIWVIVTMVVLAGASLVGDRLVATRARA